jgi:hypothetical protein
MPSLSHPYTFLAGGRWMKGNLHTHTTRSDGQREPQAVIDDYAAHGYGFLQFSDHDIFTTAADYAKWNCRGMIMLPGNEISANGPHVHQVGGTRHVQPHADRQRVIDDVRVDGGFAIVNHPNWQDRFDHCSIDNLEAWQNYEGIEIFNGTIGRLAGSPYSTNKWDMLLSAHRRVWGFANDDSHLTERDVGLGWNVAYVADPTPAGVFEALRRGRFYASTGVAIARIEVDGMTVRIATDDASRIVALTRGGRRITQADASSLEVVVPEDATYLRFECWGLGESFAWTQPFFVEH